jgi:hypothetical protein
VPIDVLLLVLTAALAAVAVGAAVVAVRASRGRPAVPAPTPVELARPAVVVPMPDRREASVVPLVTRVVDDRLVAPPTEAQVVNTALGRPQVRLAVAIRGVAFALRAESRDRIVGLMRREYRRRRAHRLRAGRRAVRAVPPAGVPGPGRPISTAETWLGGIES